MFHQELGETGSDAFLIGDAGNADHPFAKLSTSGRFFQPELPEQEEGFAGDGADPVWIAASGVQHDMGTFAGALVRKFYQDILQLERADLRHLLFVFTSDFVLHKE